MHRDRGYKGAKQLHRKIRTAIDGGPKELLAAMNMFGNVHESFVGNFEPATILASLGRAAVASGATQNKLLLPFALAFVALRSMVVEMVETDDVPRSPGVRRYFTEAIWTLGAMQHRTACPSHRLNPQRQGKRNGREVEQRLLQNCVDATDLLLKFWAATDAFLERIRVCEFVKCGRFFLDRGTTRRGRFCGVAHRVAAHRS